MLFFLSAKNVANIMPLLIWIKGKNSKFIDFIEIVL